MKQKDIFDLGEQIKDMVESAIDSHDFRKLNQTVTETINQAVSGVKKTVTSYSSVTYTSDKKVMPKKKLPALYVQKPSGSIAGPVMAIGGFMFGGVFGSTALLTVLSGVLIESFSLVLTGSVCGVFATAGILLGIKGANKWGFVKRFRRYVRQLNGREFCKIEELCSAVFKKKEVVIKDLKKMIQQGYFLQGHLDDKQQHLIISDQVYEQYQNSQNELKRRQEMEAALPNDECRTIVREGNAYIQKIHQANDDIPGQVMSDKLDRLERTMIKIFNQVEKDPDIATELHKFMKYYLPTTMKLIDAYRDLDVEQLSGENISATKKEIEDTLDTINTAFENLLDRFFQDKAWDISSDISVMKSMLAQEGLVEQDLKVSR